MQQSQASEREDLPLLQSEDELAAPQEHSEHQQPASDEPLVQTVDGLHMQPAEAQRLSMQMFFVGCAFLPWIWLVNIWLFWPAFRGKNGNAIVKRYTQWSLAGFSLLTSVLVSWSLTFALGGPQLLGQGRFNKLDVSQLDLEGAGLTL